MSENEYNPEMLQKLVMLSAGLLAIHFKATSGDIVGYAGERSFALLSKNGLALELSPTDRLLLLRSGGQPSRSEPGNPASETYTFVPRRFIEDADTLRRWLARSVGHATTLSAPRPRK